MKRNKPLRKQLFRIGLFCALLILAGLKGSIAQTDSIQSKNIENLSLKDLLNVKVTTVSKTSQDLATVPATVIVITQEQIKIRGYRSLLDVMYDLPDMKVDDKSNSSNRTSMVFRGIQGQEKFLIMLDGVRISSPTGDAVPIMENYPVNLAEQIEVVYGPASALYGADAMTGVVNIITKKSPDKKSISVDATSMVGTYGYTNNTLFIAKKLGNDAGLVLSGQYAFDQGPDYSKLYKNDSSLSVTPNSTGMYKTIFGPMTPKEPVSPGYAAPMSAYNIYGSLHAGGFSFTLFGNYSRIPSILEYNTNNAVYNKDVFVGKYINVANAAYKKTFGKFTSTSTLTASEYKIDPKSNYRDAVTDMERAYFYAYSSMVKIEQQVDWQAEKNLNITGGIGFEKYYSIPQSADLDEPVDLSTYIHGSYLGTDSYYSPNGLAAQFYTIQYSNIGGYLQAQYAPLHTLTFTLGARHDVNTRYGNTFNPRLGLVYQPFPKTTVKALFGTAFLSPTPSDYYVQNGSLNTTDSGKSFHSYFMQLPNTKLKPITSKNTELSLQQFITNNFSFTLDGFYSVTSGLHAFVDDNTSTHIYNNMFNGIPVDYIYVYINQNSQVTFGGSVQLNWKKSFGRVHTDFYAALSYVTGDVDNNTNTMGNSTPDQRIEFISPFILHTGVDVKAGKFSCSPRLIVMGKQSLTGFSDMTITPWKRQTIPGYALLTIAVRYSIMKQLSVFANITNALNEKIKTVGTQTDLNTKPTPLYYGQPQDPIRVMGGLNFNF